MGHTLSASKTFLPLAVRKTENKSQAYPVGSKIKPNATLLLKVLSGV